MAKAAKDESSNIQVAIRVRPLIERENRNNEASIVRVEDNLLVGASLTQIVYDPSDTELELQRRQMDVHHRYGSG